LEIILVSLAAFLAAILTFFSGFGLGTILTPVFMIFFPVDLAIALTGLVHFCNNIFKLFLVGKNARLSVLLRFGIPAVCAAALGAWVLLRLPIQTTLYAYDLYDHSYDVSPVEFVIALFLLIFAVFDLHPGLRNIHFDKSKLVIGGLLSGFFGGLSGHQGALRSAFLIKSGLSKEAFIGTAVVISSCVDFSRLMIYSTRFMDASLLEYKGLMISATISAVTGAYIGNTMLKKLTLAFIRNFVAVLLIVLSLALGLGFL